jgi:hypothetical protein
MSDYEAIIMFLPSCTIMTLSIFRPLQENVIGKLCGFIHTMYNVWCLLWHILHYNDNLTLGDVVYLSWLFV